MQQPLSTSRISKPPEGFHKRCNLSRITLYPTNFPNNLITKASRQGLHRASNNLSSSLTCGSNLFPSTQVTIISFSVIRSRLGRTGGACLSPRTISRKEILGISLVWVFERGLEPLSGGFSTEGLGWRWALKTMPGIEQDVHGVHSVHGARRERNVGKNLGMGSWRKLLTWSVHYSKCLFYMAYILLDYF